MRPNCNTDKLWTIPEGSFASDAFLADHEWGYGDFSVCCRELIKLRKWCKDHGYYDGPGTVIGQFRGTESEVMLREIRAVFERPRVA